MSTNPSLQLGNSSLPTSTSRNRDMYLGVTTHLPTNAKSVLLYCPKGGLRNNHSVALSICRHDNHKKLFDYVSNEIKKVMSHVWEDCRKKTAFGIVTSKALTESTNLLIESCIDTAFSSPEIRGSSEDINRDDFIFRQIPSEEYDIFKKITNALVPLNCKGVLVVSKRDHKSIYQSIMNGQRISSYGIIENIGPTVEQNRRSCLEGLRVWSDAITNGIRMDPKGLDRNSQDWYTHNYGRNPDCRIVVLGDDETRFFSDIIDRIPTDSGLRWSRPDGYNTNKNTSIIFSSPKTARGQQFTSNIVHSMNNVLDSVVHEYNRKNPKPSDRQLHNTMTDILLREHQPVPGNNIRYTVSCCSDDYHSKLTEISDGFQDTKLQGLIVLPSNNGTEIADSVMEGNRLSSKCIIDPSLVDDPSLAFDPRENALPDLSEISRNTAQSIRGQTGAKDRLGNKMGINSIMAESSGKFSYVVLNNDEQDALESIFDHVPDSSLQQSNDDTILDLAFKPGRHSTPFQPKSGPSNFDSVFPSRRGV